MAEIDDGGRAFPGWEVNEKWSKENDGTPHPGMSLRDWFAGRALPWCLHEFAGNADDGPQASAAAYQIADAMLAERKK